ncbi:hypothetical protein R2A130_2287 [Ahrensia sp. R2A130]|nr:hypothetical protein R2A130_2287 [Ahrensia sp. R2A130]
MRLKAAARKKAKRVMTALCRSVVSAANHNDVAALLSVFRDPGLPAVVAG